MSDFPIVLRKVEFVKSATHPKHYPLAVFKEVAFAGRSNVGKSSLINAMVRRKNLVKVSGTPGRTQLINFFQVNDELSIVDLPGYAQTIFYNHAIRRMVNRLLSRFHHHAVADVLVWCESCARLR